MPEELTADDLLSLYKKMYGDDFGITRLDYAQTGAGWRVRLAYKGASPAFQKTVLDSAHDGARKVSLAQAQSLRDEQFYTLFADGFFSVPPRPRRPWKKRDNKTGIPGMTLERRPSKTGSGYSLLWKVNWKEGKPKGRSFAFSSYESGKHAFIAGALARMEADLRVYGFSDIDPGEENLTQLYEQAMNNYNESVNR